MLDKIQADTAEPVDLSRLVEEMLGLLNVSISKQAVLSTNLGKNLPTCGVMPHKSGKL